MILKIKIYLIHNIQLIKRHIYCLLCNPDAYLCSCTIFLSSTIFATVNLYRFVNIFFFMFADNMFKSFGINVYKVNKLNKQIITTTNTLLY